MSRYDNITHVNVTEMSPVRQRDVQQLITGLKYFIRNSPTSIQTEADCKRVIITYFDQQSQENYTDIVKKYVLDTFITKWRESKEKPTKKGKLRLFLEKTFSGKKKTKDLEREKPATKQIIRQSISDRLRRYNRNIDFFQNPTFEEAISIAKRYGYQPKYIKLGENMIDTHNQRVTLEKDNSVRMGLTESGDKALYIAIFTGDSGKRYIYDKKDLYHDVGAIITKRKEMRYKEEAFFPVQDFIILLHDLSGERLTISDLDRLQVYHRETDSVPGTWLIDSIANKKFPLDLLENI